MRRCEVIPKGRHQFSMLYDGLTVANWNWDPSEPRPYFYPLIGPSGSELTRVGHPGAPNHDHHRSVWFAHAKVMGMDFWSDLTDARIRQREWIAIHDGDDWGGFSVLLDWVDGHNPAPLMTQRVTAILHPDEDRQYQLELQLDLEAENGSVELMTSNFGILAIRVAKSISAYFGQGQIHCSEGRVGEEQIFGKPARWMDYSGSVMTGHREKRVANREGLTYFDHPDNPSYPSKWHVREDGWMGASLCRDQGIVMDAGQVLTLRYLIDVHRNLYDLTRAERIAEGFASSLSWQVERSTKKHTHAEISHGAR